MRFFCSVRCDVVIAFSIVAVVMSADNLSAQNVKSSSLFAPSFLRGHTDAVCSVAFSPDGNRIASSSCDGTVRLWDARSGREQAVLKGHSDYVTSVAFTPDGKRIISGSHDHTVRIWDAAQHVELKCITHDAQVRTIAVSPDGKKMALSVDDGNNYTVLIRDLDTGVKVAAMKQSDGFHYQSINSLDFSSDGKRLVSGSSDGDIRICDTTTWQQIRHIEGPWGGGLRVLAVRFSRDGKWVVAGVEGPKLNGIRMWNGSSGELHQEEDFDYDYDSQYNPVHGIAFSPNGKRRVSVSHDKVLRLVDVDGNRDLAALGEYEFTSVTFHPKGTQVAAGTKDNDVLVWNIALFDSVPNRKFTSQSLYAAWRSEFLYPAFARDGRTVLSTTVDRSSLVLPRSQKPVTGGHTDDIQSVAYSRDRRLIASAGKDKTIRIWNVANQQQLAVLKGHGGAVWSVAFSPDGERLASASWDETVRVWDVESGAEVGLLQGHTNEVKCVVFSPDGSRIASGSADDTVRLWDAATLQEERVILNKGSNDITAIAFSPDGERIIAGDSEGSVHVWNVKSGALVEKILAFLDYGSNSMAHANVTGIAVTPDGSMLATASGYCRVQLWDASSFKRIAMLHGYEGELVSVAFDPSGKRILTGSSTIRLTGYAEPLNPLVVWSK